MKQKFINQSKGNERGWLIEHPDRESIKQKMMEAARKRINVDRLLGPVHKGRIFKYNEVFDSQPELFFYEQMMDKSVSCVRSVPHNGWIVDFHIPDMKEYVEIKSWYTVMELQGVNVTAHRMNSSVLFIEQEDVYGMKEVGNEWLDYLHDRSDAFKEKVFNLV